MNKWLLQKKQSDSEIMKKLADNPLYRIHDFDYKSIKSFDDACKRIKHCGSLPLVSGIPEKFRRSVIAYLKLMIIYEAINNGWSPDWSDVSQYKYFPRFEAIPGKPGIYNIGYSSTTFKIGMCTFLVTQSSEKALFIAQHFRSIYMDYLFYLGDFEVNPL